MKCSICDKETHAVSYPHREFGLCGGPLNPEDPIWDFEYDGEKAYDKTKPYCMVCYLKALKDDPMVKGHRIAEKIVGKHYTDTLNRDKDTMMRWLEGGALDSRRKEQ